MKKGIFVCVMILFVILNLFSTEDYHIFSNLKESVLTIDELAKEAGRFDVIFFGEFHGNRILHDLEYKLLQALWERFPEMAMSMEMFERDVQKWVDEYIKGNITEEEMLKHSRPWPNYSTDYKPLVDFAKERKLPIIAANVPREYAAQINLNGVEAFETIERKEYAAEKLYVKEGEYQEKFYATMQEMSHSAPMMKKSMSEERLYNLYAAQCLKDDTMAESIHFFLQKHQGKKVIHYNGDFHSNSYLGTVEKLQALNPELSIAVITPILTEEIKIFPESRKDEADFFITIFNAK